MRKLMLGTIAAKEKGGRRRLRPRRRRCMKKVDKMRKKKRYPALCATACLAAVFLLSGCASEQERLEKEAAYRAIGINAMEEQDYPAAMEAFNQALAQAKGIGADEMDICYYKAAAQFAAGSFSDAAETYGALLEADGKNADAYFLRGCVFLKINESAKAVEDFEKAVKYAANDEIYLLISDSLRGSGYEAEANAYLDEALEKKSGRSAVNDTVKGRIYLEREQYEEAAQALAEAVEKGDINANLYLAKAYGALGREKEKEACIDAYVEANPESGVAYGQLGRRAMEEGDYARAAQYFSSGLELEQVTNEQELLSNLIAALELDGDFEGAKEKMSEYVRNYPEDAAAQREYWFLGKNRSEETEKE